MLAFRLGYCLSESIAALAKNGMNDSFTPSRAAKSAFTESRSRETAVTSTSTTVVSWALTWRDSTMRWPITLRSRDIGSVLPRRGEGAWAAGAAAAAAGAAAGAAAAGAGAAGAGGWTGWAAAAAAAAAGWLGVVSVPARAAA